MARTDPQLNIRIPEELKNSLDAVAKENKRSTTSEIIARLQSSFESQENARVPDLLAQIDILKDAIEFQRKLINANDASMVMLETYIVEVVNLLPPEHLTDERKRVAARFAEDVKGDWERYVAEGRIPPEWTEFGKPGHGKEELDRINSFRERYRAVAEASNIAASARLPQPEIDSLRQENKESIAQMKKILKK